MNTDQKDRREQVFFRIVGLPSEKLDSMKQRLDGLPIQVRQRRVHGDYVVSMELLSAESCEALIQVLNASPVGVPFGLYVSLLTPNESDGVRLAPFIRDFWKSVGGDLDFSFTVISDDD
ncbi:MAG: hypothetical protein C0518_08005 [Opitutus sp.]|nr:hypothetical protein [Opitutus sp.]